MPQYLIGMYQPDGVVPPPEFLAPVMEKLGKLQAEITGLPTEVRPFQG